MNGEKESRILEVFKGKSIQGNKRGLFISEISKQTNLSRQTVKKYLLELLDQKCVKTKDVKTKDITKCRKIWCGNI